MSWLGRIIEKMTLGDLGRAETAFTARRDELFEEFRGRAQAQDRPRGVNWVSVTPSGEPRIVRDVESRMIVALVPAVVTLEPRPGSELEDVPQVREPRTVTAVFTFERGVWRTVGRAIFNLTPEEVVARSRGRYGQSASQSTI